MIIKDTTSKQAFLLKIIVFCLLFITELIFGQVAISASGGEAIGDKGSSSYTIGQIDYIQASSSIGTSNQGIQQPFEITLETDNYPWIELKAIIFPNPTTNYVNLKITNVFHQNFSYRLFDINRKLIANHKIINQETIINMERLASTTYFLSVLNKDTQIKVFKIIKK